MGKLEWRRRELEQVILALICQILIWLPHGLCDDRSRRFLFDLHPGYDIGRHRVSPLVSKHPSLLALLEFDIIQNNEVSDLRCHSVGVCALFVTYRLRRRLDFDFGFGFEGVADASDFMSALLWWALDSPGPLLQFKLDNVVEFWVTLKWQLVKIMLTNADAAAMFVMLWRSLIELLLLIAQVDHEIQGPSLVNNAVSQVGVRGAGIYREFMR